MDFKFRGRVFRFALSQGLFSAAAVDRGTAFLLKVLSQTWDQGLPPPKTMLDAGCGAGILGICAAGFGSPHIRCQDRDALAQEFTRWNALKNGIPPEVLSAYTEPLLGGDPQSRWDLILSNIPAKAGKPVLKDFVSRSAGLLNPGGRVLLVAVNPLGDSFRTWIRESGAPLLGEEIGAEHTVFLYGSLPGGTYKPIQTGGFFFQENPFYHRCSGAYQMEGVSYSLDAVQGVRDFDNPGGGVQAAAKLITRWSGKKSFPQEDLRILVHEPGQGHFPLWLLKYLGTGNPSLGLSGRNILSLEASRHNIQQFHGISAAIHPLADLAMAPRTQAYNLVAAFPELTPQINRTLFWWEGIEGLLASQGLAVIAFPGTEAERFDRKKPKSFNRILDIKQQGFRALAYQRK